MSSDASGLLLTLRKPDMLFILTLLHNILESLARLSKCLQTSEGNMSPAMTMAKAVTSSIAAIDLDNIMKLVNASKQKGLNTGENMQCGGPRRRLDPS